MTKKLHDIACMIQWLAAAEQGRLPTPFQASTPTPLPCNGPDTCLVTRQPRFIH